MPNNKVALDPKNRRIQDLEKQLAQAKGDNELLKKADKTLTTQELCRLFNGLSKFFSVNSSKFNPQAFKKYYVWLI